MRSAMIAMSGGVDSSVATILAMRDGYNCAGAVMKLHTYAENSVADAKSAAEKLGVPLHLFDFSEQFEELVIKRFIDAYRRGKTPNPCVDCNKRFKFGLLLKKAKELGMECLVTGHYAQIEHCDNGRFLLKKGAHLSKDQSYMLYTLTQEQLACLRFPLGALSKSQVRELAVGAGLENANKRESQDICFVPDGDYAKFIAGYTGDLSCKGPILDTDGNYLGEHNGVVCYTVGQRRGIGLSAPHPVYVLEVHPENNTIVVGYEDMLYSKTLDINEINLIPFDRLDAPLRAMVKIRYKHDEQPATLHQIDDDAIHIEFDKPQRAITKGQAAVIYDGDVVIGGGTIV